MSDFQCRACGSERLRPLPEAARYVNKPEGVMVYRCMTCGVVSSPDADYDYDAAYYEGYENFQPGRSAYESRAALFGGRIAYLASEAGTGRILDIGCARGHFLDLAAQQGFTTFGVEVSVDAGVAARQNGHRIANTLAEGLPFTANSFDAIHMNHVLEHVARPVQALEEIHRILKPTGRAIIEVPAELEPMSVRLKLLAARLRLATPKPLRYNPHIVYFDRKTLRETVARAGFRIVRLETRFGGPIIPSLATVPAMLARLYNRAAGIGDVIEVIITPQ